jgi:hypothetical protein
VIGMVLPSSAAAVKVIVAPATGPVSVRKVPCNSIGELGSLGIRNMALTVRVVGVGAVDGGGLVSPEDPEVTVFDELKLHELPAVQFWSFTR